MLKAVKPHNPQRLDDKTREILAAFLRPIRELPNEATKRMRFATLIGELFPGSKAVHTLVDGRARL